VRNEVAEYLRSLDDDRDLVADAIRDEAVKILDIDIDKTIRRDSRRGPLRRPRKWAATTRRWDEW